MIQVTDKQKLTDKICVKLTEACRYMVSANNIIDPSFDGPQVPNLDLQQILNVTMQLRQAAIELEQLTGAMEFLKIYQVGLIRKSKS